MHCERPERADDRRGALLSAFRSVWIAAVSAALLGFVLPPAAFAIETATFPANDPAPERPQPKLLILSATDATIHLSENGEDVLSVIEMELGKSVYLKTQVRVKRVSVGNPETLDVVVLGANEIQLVPKVTGVTNVVLWTDAGRPIAAIDVQIGAAYSQLESQLRLALSEPGIEVSNAGSAIVLKGAVSSEAAAAEAVNMTRAYLGEDSTDRLVNLVKVGGHHQVMLKVVVAEMSRRVTRKFGTNFSALIQKDGKSFIFDSFIGGLTQLDENGDTLLNAVNFAFGATNLGGLEVLKVFLDALDERGLSKILAEPTLVARSGETAHFLVGGEVPIPITQGGATAGSITIEFKEFGIGLGFTPTVLSENRIHLAVKPEVSEPDLSLGTEVGGTIVPAFKTRKAETAVELADGQSFAIAGLLSDSVRGVSSKYPLVGSIPIIGALFRSAQWQQEETELVILVTPHLVKPLGPGPHPLPTNNYIEPSMTEFYFLGLLEGIAPPEETDERSSGLIGDVGYRVSSDSYWSEN
jgi:pilus assembly protein CpaC